MKQKWFNIGISVAVAALLVAGVFAFNATNQPEARGTQHFGAATFAGAVLVDGASDADQLTVQGHTTQTTDLLVLEQSDGTDKFTVDDSGNAIISGTFTLEAVTSSGPVRFGSAASVISGTTIAHGLGTTPTAALLTASGVVTAHPMILSTDLTSITVGFLTTENPPAMTVYWLAGK